MRLDGSLSLETDHRLVIPSALRTNYSTLQNKCSESHHNCLEEDPTWVSLEGDGGRPGSVCYSLQLVHRSAAATGQGRDGEQLRTSRQPRQPAAFGVGTGAHTQLSVDSFCQMLPSPW